MANKKNIFVNELRGGQNLERSIFRKFKIVNIKSNQEAVIRFSIFVIFFHFLKLFVHENI